MEHLSVWDILGTMQQITAIWLITSVLYCKSRKMMSVGCDLELVACRLMTCIDYAFQYFAWKRNKLVRYLNEAE